MPIVKGAIAMVVIYEFITFSIYAFIDYKKWKLNKKTIDANYESKILDDLNNASKEHYPLSTQPVLDEDFSREEQQEIELANLTMRHLETIEPWKLIIEEHQSKLKQLSNRANTIDITQVIKIYGVEWGIPLVLGIVGICKNYAFITGFVRELFL